MRILSWPLPSEGHLSEGVPLNQEEGYLEIGHSSLCQVLPASHIIAERLSLHCRLDALPLQYPSPYVQLISERTPLDPVALYSPHAVMGDSVQESENSQYRAIVVVYRGHGVGKHAQGDSFLIRGKNLPEGSLDLQEPLYIKPFSTEKENVRLHITTVGAGGLVLTSPPGVMNTSILRGYGGYYKPGAPLSTCEQVYYGLTSDYAQTRIYLSTTSSLKARGVSIPEGGNTARDNFLFTSALREEDYLSFSGAIAAGYARLSVVSDLGVQMYASYLAEPVPGHPHFITLHFTLL